jgi:hypothetical protein
MKTMNRETGKDSILELLNEYEEECLNAVKLIEGLKLRTLTEEQTEDLIGELSASITHLRIHSETMEETLEKELVGE